MVMLIYHLNEWISIYRKHLTFSCHMHEAPHPCPQCSVLMGLILDLCGFSVTIPARSSLRLLKPQMTDWNFMSLIEILEVLKY